MKIVVAGSHGLIGTALVARLAQDGHEVSRLVRGAPSGPAEVPWDPAHGVLDPRALEGAGAVVNLAGAGVGDKRLTDAYKEVVRTSRTSTTSLLARTIARLDGPRPVLLQASGIGAYGERGDEVLDETSALGDTFFAGVVRDWEAAAQPAVDAGARVAFLRTGIVLAPQGGALERMLPLLRAGVAGRLGTGRQFWSWITLPDEIGAIVHLLHADVSGPVNLSAPHPATNEEITRELARVLHRPALIPVPSLALKLVLGDFSSEVLGSIRALPAVLVRSGFQWEHPAVDDAVAWVAGEVRRGRS
ncbi:TIGR01777 family oxidoreductase [Cellulomonas sp. ATA003]|uniref:TIGR01777 family oxidoreductase n=1 Tax=Cellulomonas sp. ATA003 TaxID=3073064 RepID=UPI00287387BE|nr:TIGR01777 family oxidoreductase [Cellulomonas sp. ATA003]WNB84480.1 TIGR01777 family oxidoreductase [Cellulomonas sp. ATA003]